VARARPTDGRSDHPFASNDQETHRDERPHPAQRPDQPGPGHSTRVADTAHRPSHPTRNHGQAAGTVSGEAAMPRQQAITPKRHQQKHAISAGGLRLSNYQPTDPIGPDACDESASVFPRCPVNAVPHTGHPPQRTTPPMGQPIRPHQPQPRLPPAVLPAPCRTPSRLASPDTAEARDVCLGHPRSHMRIVGCRADASRGAPAMRATRGAPTDEQPRDSSDMQGQPALSRPRSYQRRLAASRRAGMRPERGATASRKSASGALRGACSLAPIA